VALVVSEAPGVRPGVWLPDDGVVEVFSWLQREEILVEGARGSTTTRSPTAAGSPNLLPKTATECASKKDLFAPQRWDEAILLPFREFPHVSSVSTNANSPRQTISAVEIEVKLKANERGEKRTSFCGASAIVSARKRASCSPSSDVGGVAFRVKSRAMK